MPVHLRISKSIKRRPANYFSVMRLEDLLMELQPMPTRSPREKLELVLWTRKTSRDLVTFEWSKCKDAVYVPRK